MTNVGAVYEVKKTLENGTEQKWMELIIEMPFMERLKCAIYPNKKKQNPNDPSWLIWRSYSRKGESFRAVQIGAIWDKVSKKGESYKAGHIESAVMSGGKMYFSLFKSKVYDGEDAKRVTWAYDVMYAAPEAKNQGYSGSNSGYGQTYDAPPAHYYGDDVNMDYGVDTEFIVE